MKKNFLALIAVVFAILVSAFTTDRLITMYAVYDGAGTESDYDNWSFTSSPQTPEEGEGVINWFSFSAADDDVSEGEFDDAFLARDLIANGQLSDEELIPGVLDKKVE